MATLLTRPSVPRSPSEAAPLPEGIERIVVVAAVALDGAIGRNGSLPWHLSEDLRHFRRLTEGHVVIMGRKTWESIGRPLPRRTNVVLSRSRSFQLPQGVLTAGSLPEALRLSAAYGDDAPRIIGGAQVYRQTLPLAEELWITRVALSVPDADAFFPEPPPAAFRLLETRPGDDPRLTFQHWIRR